MPVALSFRAAVVAAALLVAAMLVEQFTGAPLRAAFWPVTWASALLFFAAVADRQWGRVMLAVQAGLTVLLAPVLLFPQPSELDSATRPGPATGLAVAYAVLHLVAAGLAFLPGATARDLTPRVRRAVLVVHVTSSVGWLGIITVQGSLGITAVTTDDPGVARAMFTAMLVIDASFLGPAAFLALFTGIALAAGTRWRLLHRWWVTTKFATMLVLMVLPIVAWQDIPVDGHALVEAGRPLTELRRTLGATPYLAMISPALATFLVVLSVTKPWGMTPLGRRKPVRPQEYAGRSTQADRR